MDIKSGIIGDGTWENLLNKSTYESLKSHAISTKSKRLSTLLTVNVNPLMMPVVDIEF